MLPAPTAFLRDVVRYNAFYIARQACYIGRTISFIRDDDAAVAAKGVGGASTVGADTSGRLRRQLCKSIRWCHKYGITTSMDALLKYRPMVTPLVAPSS